MISKLGLTGEAQPNTVGAKDYFGDALPVGALARLGTIRFRHSSTIAAMAYSPDGNWLAAAGMNHAAVFNAKTGERIHLLPYPGMHLKSIVFSKDSKFLAGGGGYSDHSNPILLWDLRDGSVKMSFRETDGDVSHLAFTSDQSLLISLHTNSVGNAWSIKNMKHHETFTFAGKPLALSHSGKRWVEFIAGELRVRSARTNLTLCTLPLPKDVGFYGVAPPTFSSDEKFLAIHLVVKPGEQPRLKKNEQLLLWNLKTGRILNRLPLTTSPQFLKFIPGGEELLIFSAKDRKVDLVDLKSFKISRSWKVAGGYSRDLSISPDGQQLAIGDAQQIRIWDIKNGKAIHQDSKFNCFRAEFKKSNQDITVFSRDRIVEFDWRKDRVIKIVKFPVRNGFRIGLSHDLRYTAYANFNSPPRIWNEQTNREALQTERYHPKPIGRVAFSPDGHTFATGQTYLKGVFGQASEKMDVSIWNLASGHLVKVLGTHRHDIYNLKFSHTGKFLASSGSKYFRVWKIRSNEEVWSSKWHTGHVHAFDFSKDDRFLATASMDKTIGIWDLKSGRRTVTLKGHSVLKSHENSKHAVSFLSHGFVVAGAGHDKTIRLWEVATGARIALLKGHDGSVRSVSISNDGKYLASVGSEGVGYIWDVWEIFSKNRFEHASLKELFLHLSNKNSKVAFSAMARLIRKGDKAIAFLEARLQKKFSKTSRLVADLDHEEMEVRVNAEAELLFYSHLVKAELQRALRKTTSLEVQTRLKRILKTLKAGGFANSVLLQRLRCIQVFANIHSRASLQALKNMVAKTPNEMEQETLRSVIKRCEDFLNFDR